MKAFISASAVGYYGAVTTSDIRHESDLPGEDFLAQTCILWEKAAEQFGSIGIRMVKIRTAIVLMKNEGALKRMLTPSRLGLATVLGSRNQYLPWIHIDDLCEIYYNAIIDETFNGTFNAVAPSFITNYDFMVALKTALKKSLLMVYIPKFLLKIAIGELSVSLLNGNRISSDKILNTGYKFIFDTPDKALFDLLKS